MPPLNEYLVSAIVSTYASRKFIRGALEDLCSQTIFPRVEVIVIDSASPEEEGAIVREYTERYPDNVFYHRTARRESLYAAWNRGIRMARGKYLTSANADDRHSHDAFELLAGALVDHPEAAVAYGDYAETNVPNDRLGPQNMHKAVRSAEFRRGHLLVDCFVGSQPMWRRSLHEELGYFREDLKVAGDLDFWNRVARLYRFIHVPHVTGLMYSSMAGDNLARKRPEETLRETTEVADLHLRQYWADLIPRVAVIWMQDGNREDWRGSFASLARQSVRPERVYIVGSAAEEALKIWEEFPGAIFDAKTFRLRAGEENGTWERVLDDATCPCIAYLKGNDTWDDNHIERMSDWMGETHYRLVKSGPDMGQTSISDTAHHSCVLPWAREVLSTRGSTPFHKEWWPALKERFEESVVPLEMFYPLRCALSMQARERFRDAVCHFHRKGKDAVPKPVNTTLRPFYTFLREYMAFVAGKRKGDAFSGAVWKAWNNWIRYSLRKEAHALRTSWKGSKREKGELDSGKDMR
jgi:glycosyltransferase involved in cell wall biosynthesis